MGFGGRGDPGQSGSVAPREVATLLPGNVG